MAKSMVDPNKYQYLHRYCTSSDYYDALKGYGSTMQSDGRYKTLKVLTRDDKNPVPSAEDVNKDLNLNLGLSIDPMNPTIRAVGKLLSDVFSLVEDLLYFVWLCIPLFLRHNITVYAWTIYFNIHKVIAGKSSGIHKDASYEYHAFTSIAWWTRLFPMTIERMRFGLNQIEVWNPPSGKAYSVEEIDCDTTGGKGIYVQINEKPADRVIFWLYGGAYLSGDTHGNLGTAEFVARATNCDVFLCEYRLLPENEFLDCIGDARNGYEFIISVKKIKPSDIILFGISSGAGIAVYIMQEMTENLEESKLPRAAALMCPFVDYTEPQGSLVHYAAHDLIVTQSVYKIGIPYLAIKLGSHENRVKSSPVYRSMKNLPPMLVIASEHESCYDMDVLLVNNARAQGVKVDFAVFKYLCHVFPMLKAIIPEGSEAMDAMIEWINDH